ncbi:MAG: MFS transporter [Bradyrhizobium sp.]
MTPFRRSLDLLFSRRFGTFWFANLLSNMGTWTQQVAEPWLLLSIGASSFVIGLDAFAMAAPAWLLTLVGGVLADRGDRRRVIAIYQSIEMLCPAALVVLILTGVVQPWMVVALSLVVGITDALSMPSFQTIVPSLVRRDQIATALALNATQFNLSRIIGPALAGVLMASMGAVACFSVNAASYVPFILVALWILPRGRTASGDRADAASARRPLTGFQHILRQPKLRGALLTVFLTSLLCGPLIVFCPILIKDALHGDVTNFSGAMGAFGLGGLLGALMLLAVDTGLDRRRLSSWFAIGYGVVVMLAALTPWLWGLAALLIFAGISMNVSNTSANALLQSAAPPRLLGQTVSLYMLALRGGVSVGSFVTGITVGSIGVREALFLNGSLAVIGQLIVLQKRRRSPSGKAAI